ncbi:hypothetical protein [Sporichthya polymorpha]|uniref:hypothetical protein n=1 Tax=Sporichthya polymorpha TaxID=35751 RepID=UPI0003655B69|nr:hypothetical protein [Sporichthya polymorpha]
MRTDILGWLRLQWDRAGAWGCVLAGAVTLFIGWLGVSETAYTAKQLPYIAGCGLGGMALIGVGAMLWLSADLRDEWRKLDRIEQAIRESGAGVLPTAENGATATEQSNGHAGHRGAARPTVAVGRS